MLRSKRWIASSGSTRASALAAILLASVLNSSSGCASARGVAAAIPEPPTIPEAAIDEIERDMWLPSEYQSCNELTDYLLTEVEPYFDGIRAMRGDK